jgi:hypothetical protein
MLAMIAAACVVPPEPAPVPDPLGLRVSLGDGTLELEWSAPEGAPSGAAPYSYDIEVGSGGWQPLATTPDTSFSFTDVQHQTYHQFRVRVAADVDAGRPAGEWGPAVTALYVDLALPVVRIDTEGRQPILDKETDIDGTLTIDPNGSGYDPYAGVIEIRGRGNSTWELPKKPYRLELDEDSSLMGMPVHEDFVLLANALDASQLRNWAAARISEATELAYTPRYRHVEVVLNGEYQGAYLLTEDPDKIDPNRIDITEMKKADIAGEALTGGYLLEIDDRLEMNGEQGFRTTRGVPVVVKEPDPATPEQLGYIQARVQAFEDALFAGDLSDPAGGLADPAGYGSLLDVDSFIDHYIVQELTRNQDSFWSSTFFTKDRSDDLFRFGPVWDFDLSFGRTIIYGQDGPPQGFHVRGRMPWTTEIFDDPAFVARVGERWEELRPTIEQLPAELVDLGAQLRGAISSDEVRWAYALQPTDQPQHLADFLTARMAWFEEQYPAP